MKWPYYVKNKLKVAGVLTAIIAIVLISILTERKSFSKLDHSISSIYEDRLMPATYIFEITDHLYQKRLIHEQSRHSYDHTLAAQVQQHNAAIDRLIASYEKTFLTKEEQLQWQSFKANLKSYRNAEDVVIASSISGSNISKQTLLEQERNFSNALYCLNSLSKIQVGEGGHLQETSRTIINGNILTSNLEISLLIVLGLYTLVLLSASDKVLFKPSQQQSLN